MFNNFIIKSSSIDFYVGFVLFMRKCPDFLSVVVVTGGCIVGMNLGVLWVVPMGKRSSSELSPFSGALFFRGMIVVRWQVCASENVDRLRSRLSVDQCAESRPPFNPLQKQKNNTTNNNVVHLSYPRFLTPGLF